MEDYLSPVYQLQTEINPGQFIYEIYPEMGKVIKVRVNDADMSILIKKKLVEGKIHKYIDIFRGKEYIKKGCVNTLKIWTDKKI